MQLAPPRGNTTVPLAEPNCEVSSAALLLYPTRITVGRSVQFMPTTGSSPPLPPAPTDRPAHLTCGRSPSPISETPPTVEYVKQISRPCVGVCVGGRVGWV